MLALVVSPDGRWAASAASDGTVILWDAHQQIRSRAAASGKLQDTVSLSFSHDSERLARAGVDELLVWRIDEHGRVSRSTSVIVKGTTIASCSWSSPTHLSVVCADATIRILHGSTFQLLRVLPLASTRTAPDHTKARLKTILFSPGRWLLSEKPDSPHDCCLWDIASGKLRKILRGHSAPVTTAAIDSTGTRLATASMDHTVRVWEIASAALVAVLRGHSAPVLDVAFSPDGRHVLSASEDKKAKIWPVAGGECTLSFKHFNWVQAARFSPDGRYVATASWDHTVRLFRVSDGSLVKRFWEHEGAPARHVAFSPDGMTLWSGADDGSVAGHSLSNLIRAI